MKFEDFQQEMLKNADVKAEYDLLTPQYELIKQVLALRQEQHLTQKALAEKTGIAQSAISRFESGNHNPSLEFLQRLAQGFVQICTCGIKIKKERLKNSLVFDRTLRY